MEQVDLEVYSLEKKLKELRAQMGEHPPETLVKQELELENRLKQVEENISPLHGPGMTVLIEVVGQYLRYTYFKQNRNGAEMVGAVMFSAAPRGYSKMYEWSCFYGQEEHQGIARTRSEAREAALQKLTSLFKPFV